MTVAGVTTCAHRLAEIINTVNAARDLPGHARLLFDYGPLDRTPYATLACNSRSQGWVSQSTLKAPV
jgi:hypothetical protein